MKKTIFAMTIMFTVGLTSVFANDKINDEITSSFRQQFVNAQDVKWKNENDYVKATFNMDGQVMYAFYSKDAQFLGVARNILSDKLPINLMTGIKKNYSDYWISDLFELACDNQSNYYITLENADEHLVLKSDDNGQWSVYKRTKKN